MPQFSSPGYACKNSNQIVVSQIRTPGRKLDTYSEEAIAQSPASLDEAADDGLAEPLVVGDLVHQLIR